MDRRFKKQTVRCPICGEVAEYIYWKRANVTIIGCDKCIKQIRAVDALYED